MPSIRATEGLGRHFRALTPMEQYFLDVLSGATQWEDPVRLWTHHEDKSNVDVDSGVTIPTALHNLKVARRDQIKSSKADEDEESNRINGSKEGKETGGKAEVGNEKKAGGVRELDAIAAAAAAASSAAAAAMAEYSGSSASTSPRGLLPELLKEAQGDPAVRRPEKARERHWRRRRRRSTRRLKPLQRRPRG